MSELNSTEYYRKREQQERDLAAAAISPHIAKIHLEMADRYLELGDQARPQAHLRLARFA